MGWHFSQILFSPITYFSQYLTPYSHCPFASIKSKSLSRYLMRSWCRLRWHSSPDTRGSQFGHMLLQPGSYPGCTICTYLRCWSANSMTIMWRGCMSIDQYLHQVDNLKDHGIITVVADFTWLLCGICKATFDKFWSDANRTRVGHWTIFTSQGVCVRQKT